MAGQVGVDTTIVPVEHVRVLTDTPFAEIVERLKAEAGRFELADVQRRVAAGESPQLVIDSIARMAGPSGFMLFLEIDHGAILRLHGQNVQAVRFLIGHPLIAVRMTKRAVASALYAPLSLLVASDGDGACLEYDRPSTLFAQFQDAEITNVARELDQKFDALMQSITRLR
jgi:uncharacterized protein (DUF302 family)